MPRRTGAPSALVVSRVRAGPTCLPNLLVPCIVHVLGAVARLLRSLRISILRCCLLILHACCGRSYPSSPTLPHRREVLVGGEEAHRQRQALIQREEVAGKHSLSAQSPHAALHDVRQSVCNEAEQHCRCHLTRSCRRGMPFDLRYPSQ